MSGQSFTKTLLVFFFILFVTAGMAGAQKPEASKDVQGSTDSSLRTAVISDEEPVEITAEKLIADNRAHTAVFEGSVVARQGKITLYADWMKVFYSEAGDIRKIEARGNVKLVKDAREITSGEAIYYKELQKIVFTGNPVATEGNSTISGDRMVYYITNDRSVVENSRVIIKKQNGP
ncbi:hypothetical protein MNBD_NITROSPIRAE02-1597 [hydrothermal vent metagenome]|uniref:Organic solvent tolerance-like N-terminal domain-containing protein n=1 Tax=hydrothermal vent metagenome TaxID=652676 RepID=A0A3B1CPZ8_9ZZZZ